jgi:hypothetical protein
MLADGAVFSGALQHALTEVDTYGRDCSIYLGGRSRGGGGR